MATAYRRLILVFLTGICLLLPVCAYSGQMVRSRVTDKYAISVTAVPVPLNYKDSNITTVGKLHYMGGIKITSNWRRFGGISSLEISPDGRHILGLSDSNQWLVTDVVYDDRGHLVDIENVRMARLKNLPGDNPRDAEAVTAVDGSGYVVSFENPHVLRYFQANHPYDYLSLFSAHGRKITFAPDLPENYASLRDNMGIEALTTMGDGRLLAFSEKVINHGGNKALARGWIMGRGKIESLSYEIAPSYRPTDMATLPGGDILVLERHFSLARGMAARLTRLPASSVKAGRTLRGVLIADLAFPFNLDNMEALAVRQNRAGETIIYIMSDNNYSRLQRTLLMMFRLDEDIKKAIVQVNGLDRIPGLIPKN